MEAQLLKHWSMTVIHYFMSNGKKEQQAIVKACLFFISILFTATVAMDGIARATMWTNKMGYITSIAQLPGIYGSVLGLGRFTAINPRQLGYNYYILSSSQLNVTGAVPTIIWIHFFRILCTRNNFIHFYSISSLFLWINKTRVSYRIFVWGMGASMLWSNTVASREVLGHAPPPPQFFFAI